MKKILSESISYAIAFVILALAYVLASGYALMLLLGCAHSWDNAIPTIGFWQSLAPAVLIRLLTTSVSSQTKKERK